MKRRKGKAARRSLFVTGERSPRLLVIVAGISVPGYKRALKRYGSGYSETGERSRGSPRSRRCSRFAVENSPRIHLRRDDDQRVDDWLIFIFTLCRPCTAGNSSLRDYLTGHTCKRGQVCLSSTRFQR